MIGRESTNAEIEANVRTYTDKYIASHTGEDVGDLLTMIRREGYEVILGAIEAAAVGRTIFVPNSVRKWEVLEEFYHLDSLSQKVVAARFQRTRNGNGTCPSLLPVQNALPPGERPMRVRHKIPSIFNLSMVDVLCSPLGCVILLWLMNLKIAKEHEGRSALDKKSIESAKSEVDQNLAASERDRRAAEIARDQAKQALGNLDERLRKLLEEKGLLETEVKDRDQRIEDLLAKLKVSDQDKDKQLALIKEAERSNQKLLDKLKELELSNGKMLSTLKLADQSIEKQQIQIKENQTAYEKLLAKLKDASRTQAKYEAEIKTLESDRDRLRDNAGGMDDRLKKLLAEKTLLEKELKDGKNRYDAIQSSRADSELGLKELRGKLSLAERDRDEALSRLRGIESRSTDSASALERAHNELEVLRRDADNRFAGIELSGKRVIFLVDMSGSMGYVKEDMPAPLKWAGVRETVVKIMRSLPALEKYQLLVFSDRQPIFLLGKPGEWLAFDAKKSPLQVSQALENLKPEGGTNMYDAFRTAFEFRRGGLDTIYFFSDGLPNVGDGLSAADAKTLNDVQKGEKLGKHILKKLSEEWNVAVGGKRPVKINAIGFFFESPDLGAFLWTLARSNEGGFVGMSKP